MLLVPISWGELLDKLTILEIKQSRLQSPLALANVNRELGWLRQAAQSHGAGASGAELARLTGELKAINLRLWEIEDAIRICDGERRFDGQFVALARSVYRTNDERSAVKKQINELMGSPVLEQKLYASYGTPTVDELPRATKSPDDGA